MHDVKKARGYYARKVGALVRDFDDAELFREYQPFLEVLTSIARLLEVGKLSVLHQTIITVNKRCPLVHLETKRRRVDLWERIVIIQREVTTQAEDDPELKELKLALALVNRALTGDPERLTLRELTSDPERLTLGPKGAKVTVTAFFQEQMLLAAQEILTVAKVA